MVKAIKIAKPQLPEYIMTAFRDDKDLLEKYHAVNTGFEDSVVDTLNRIEETSAHYRLNYYKVIYKDKPIGFFIKGNNFLYSFGLNIKHRTRAIVPKWWDLVKKELKPNFKCPMNNKNTRGINFLKRQGMVVEAIEDDITVLKYA